MEKLNYITGIKGFMARSFMKADEFNPHIGGMWYNST